MATDESINNSGIPEIQMDLTPVSTPAIGMTLQASSVVTQPTDKTLTIEDQPADAKATGDAIAEIEGDVTDLALSVAANAGAIETINDALPGYVPKTDIETTLETSGKVADSKATGDAISALETEITNKIDTTLAVQGGIAEAKATGDAIAAAITSARSGVVLSIDGITSNSSGELTLASLLPSASEINAMIDVVAV